MLTRLLTLLAATALFTACAEDPDPQSPPPDAAEITLEYISGHLGAYWDCPDDAMPARAARGEGQRAAAPEADGGAGLIAGDCADENCGFLNCQAAELRLRVTNDGDAPIDALVVKQLQLDWDGELSHNDVVSVHDTDGEFDGQIEPGESVDLRIEYRGPHPSDVDWDQGLPAIIEMGEGNQSQELITPELQMVPQVAT